jgi:acetyl-CoA C-acetyltransferase
MAAIVSAGLSKFGKRDGLYARELFAEASRECFENCANLRPSKDIQALYVGQMCESYEHQAHIAPLMLDWTGLGHIPAVRVENACSSSGSALRSGIMAIMSGLYDVVMVGGVEKMTHLSTQKNVEYLAMASDFEFEQRNGMNFPALYALMAIAHMNKYGTTEKQMAMVAVKNHKNGAMNPKAHMQKEITLENALSSKPVAWPLKLYDCSLITDGASCMILTKPSLARKFTDEPVYVVGSGQANDTLNLFEREDLTSIHATQLAAREAYKMVGMKPSAVDVAEVHDCFTIAEIMAYEDLGFCKKGTGGKFIEEGETLINGRMPVNPSGGLKSKGHPVGATGVAQACEIFLQLTRSAGKRQVQDAEVGLTQNIGGSGATAVVNIYSNR